MGNTFPTAENQASRNGLEKPTKLVTWESLDVPRKRNSLPCADVEGAATWEGEQACRCHRTPAPPTCHGRRQHILVSFHSLRPVFRVAPLLCRCTLQLMSALTALFTCRLLPLHAAAVLSAASSPRLRGRCARAGHVILFDPIWRF
jgi:hypothetical protein